MNILTRITTIQFTMFTKNNFNCFRNLTTLIFFFQYSIINSLLNQQPENLNLDIFVQQCQKHVTKLDPGPKYKNGHTMLEKLKQKQQR